MMLYLWSMGCRSRGGTRSSRGDGGSSNIEAAPSCSFSVSCTATWRPFTQQQNNKYAHKLHALKSYLSTMNNGQYDDHLLQ